MVTRNGNPSGLSSVLPAPPPVRSANDNHSKGNGSDRARIQKAVDDGKNISGLLADALGAVSLADIEESNLHSILLLAQELQEYTWPIEFTIGLVGDSGVGKSSLINSLLGVKDLATTAGVGSACTSVAFEYRNKRDGDTAPYTVEIECMNEIEVEDLLQQCVLNYRRYHTQHLERDEAQHHDAVAERPELKVKAEIAWDTLLSVFTDQHLSEAYFKNPNLPNEDLIAMVLGWNEEKTWPPEFRNGTANFTNEEAGNFTERIGKYMPSWMWPFNKVVRIYLDAAVLKNGIVLVDLPGFRDVNSARVRVTETRLFKCDEIFIVAEIVRAATDQSVNDLIVKKLGKNFDKLRKKQGVAIVCTKSESFEEAEILRAVQPTDVFNRQRMDALEREIDNMDYAGDPTETLNMRRNGYFISARNEHVKGEIRSRYRIRGPNQVLNVHCVSSNLYWDGEKKKRTARDSTVDCVNDKRSARKKMLDNSGIPALREFIQGIPSDFHISETQHFLETRLLDLLQKVGIWLNARVVDVAANQPIAPGFLQDLQDQLRRKFDLSVENGHTGLSNAKVQILRHVFSTQNMTRWENTASVVISPWQYWAAGTVVAFWNREGAYQTKAQAYTNWNEEIIKGMLDDIQGLEDGFLTESESIFGTMRNSAHQGLDWLVRHNELQRVDNFRETFPRRGRNLNHDFDSITDKFVNELQTIFHNLLNTHGSSYVMQYMLPMYREHDSGGGIRVRRIDRILRQVSGPPVPPNDKKLFVAIRNSFLTNITRLLENTEAEFQEAVNRCSADIANDLDLLRGEAVPVADDGNIPAIFELLEQAKRDRIVVLGQFEREM